MIRIRDKSGRETVINVPDDAQVAVERDGKPVFDSAKPAEEKPAPAPAEKPAAKEEEMKEPSAPPPSAPKTPTPPNSPPTVPPPSPAASVAVAAEAKTLGSGTLVPSPAPITSLKNWTIEPVGHRGAVARVVYSPDGRWLASAGFDGTIRIWDGGDQRLVRIIRSAYTTSELYPATYVNTSPPIAWSSDNRLLAAGSLSGKVTIFEADTGKGRGILPTSGNSVDALAWSPDGLQLAVRNSREKTIVWELSSGQVVKELTHAGELKLLRWTADGRRLSTVDVAGEVQVIEIASGTVQESRKVAISKPVIAVDLSADGQSLVLTQEDGKVVLCAALTDEPAVAVPPPFGGGTRALAGAWSPKGDALACIAEPSSWGSLVTLSASTKKVRVGFAVESGACVPTWRSDSKRLVTASSSGSLFVCDVNQSEPAHVIPGALSRNGGSAYSTCCWSRDGRTPIPGEPKGDWPLGLSPPYPNGEPGVLSPNGRYVACPAGEDVVVYDRWDGKEVRKIPGRAWAADFSPDGNRIVLGNPGNTARVWNLDTGKVLLTLTAKANKDSFVHCVKWSPDGSVIVTRPYGEGAQLWDAASGKLLANLPTPGISDVAFSPDSHTLVIAVGSVVQTWDVQSQSLLETFEYPVYSNRRTMAWTADGKHLVLCCANNKLVVFDPRSGKEVQVIEGLPLGGILKKEGTLYVWPEKCGIVRAFDIPNNQLLGTILNLRDDRWLSLTPEGHYRGNAGIEKDIVYVATTDAGEQITLTPEEFEKRFGWKNDPSKVKLTPAE